MLRPRSDRSSRTVGAGVPAQCCATVAALAALATGAGTIGDGGPGPRNGHGAVYDTRNGTLVVFGGASASEVRGDTWRWRRGVWRRLPGPGPGARTFPAMAYDAGRGEVVLFGGNRVLFGDSLHPPAMLGDTWLLREGRWRRGPEGGPSARAEAAVAYDPARGRTVLFGGYDRQGDGGARRLGDTWEWDGIRWQRVSDTGPPPRSGAAMAYHPARGVVLFGGSGGPRGDTWAWNGRLWSRVPVPDAPGRFNAVMAPDPCGGRLVRFGGWDGQGRVGDTWELGEHAWTLVVHDGPPARNHAILAGAPDRCSLLLFGGHDGDRVFADLWERRRGHWAALEKVTPVPRVANGH